MPILTLTSDIGQHDFLAGAVKGQLLQAGDLFSLVDISHQISPFNYPQAAYVCRNAIKNFPVGIISGANNFGVLSALPSTNN